MSAELDPSNSERRESRLPRSPRLSGTSPHASGPSGAYRPRSRSLASPSLIAPASYSPSPSSVSSTNSAAPPLALPPPAQSPSSRRRVRAASLGNHPKPSSTTGAESPRGAGVRRIVHDPVLRERARHALETNDAMVYLDGPQVYACQQCRTHLTSHDDVVSKSFHGRRGRAYLFDQCVNVTEGTPEDRLLITGLHSVCDIHCQRCDTLVGWTYKRAYENSQKYKEGKFIIEKINLYLEESDTYSVEPAAGERRDRWRRRSRSWGSEGEGSAASGGMVYEYAP